MDKNRRGSGTDLWVILADKGGEEKSAEGRRVSTRWKAHWQAQSRVGRELDGRERGPYQNMLMQDEFSEDQKGWLGGGALRWQQPR